MNIKQELKQRDIKAIIGLGNPGPRFVNNRHNIGFLVLDAIADAYGAQWQLKGNIEQTQLMLNGKKVILIKPQTFMNDSGQVIPALQKKGIKAENILVVHDELEKKFGGLSFKIGGSHRGHNGLRSIIGACGADFARLRFGIGRPERKEDVADYVLQNFKEPQADVEQLIEDAVRMIETLF